MEFSLDNPRFEIDVSDQVEVHQSDVSRLSSGSSSSGESTRRSCARCHGRMSSFSLDRHLFRIRCRGSECDLNSRCDECLSWTKEEIEGYIKLHKSLSSKSKKNKNPMKTSTSPPRPTAPIVDLDARFAAQLETVNRSVDDKLNIMSSALMSQFVSMLDQFKLGFNNSSFSENPGVLGPSVSHTKPVSLQHPVSTKIPLLGFQDGGEDPVPHGSGLAQGGNSLARPQLGSDAALSRDPPAEVSGKTQRPSDPSGPRVSFTQPLEPEHAQHPEDDGEDDRDSVADPPVLDKTFSRLINFIYDRFSHARPVTNASAPPRCDFEEYFAVSEPHTAARQNLTVYPRVSEIIDASSEKASRLARESRPLHEVVPLRRKVFFARDNQDFCNARFVNSDFARISNNKTILKTRLSSVNLADLERIERASRTVLAGDSQCFWLLSSLLAQLKDDDYRPSDPALFDRNISALSAALASQTAIAAGVTDFITSKRRESYLAHASCPIAESQKRELLVAPGTGSLLFDQLLLDKIVSQMKEDSWIASSVSLSNLSKAAARGRSGSSGGDRYVSSLDQSRPGPSSYRKRAASPARGSFAKCGRRGRGMTPPSGKGKGFQK